MQDFTGSTDIYLYLGDITSLHADAIVNAGNTMLFMGSGVAGAIKKKAGDQVEKEAMAQGPIQPGETVVTGGGRLDVRYIIHAAVMDIDYETKGDIIARATYNSLRRADDLGVDTVALPALGTGMGGYTIEDCAHIMIKETKKYIMEQNNSLREIILVLNDSDAFYKFKKVFYAVEDEIARDRARGCLVGGAVGDALGMPAESLTHEEIEGYYGAIDGYVTPVAGLPCSYLKPGQYTDDTQMTIAIAQSIIDRGSFNPRHAAKKLMEWGMSGDVRCAGRATMEAVENLIKGIEWNRSGVPSAGNGCAIRVSPIGIINMGYSSIKLANEAKACCIITHTHEIAIASSIALASGISYLVYKGHHLLSGQHFIDILCEQAQDISPDLIRALRSVSLLLDREPREAFKILGTGGYVLETLPAAVYCFLKYPRDFEGAVVCAANAGDDTDSIAAIAGNLSGAYNGYSNIPDKFLYTLEGRDHIAGLADELFSIRK
jgi:ADP-ribosyl-[dinitrogen reductase] hydrolase